MLYTEKMADCSWHNLNYIYGPCQQNAGSVSVDTCVSCTYGVLWFEELNIESSMAVYCTSCCHIKTVCLLPAECNALRPIHVSFSNTLLITALHSSNPLVCTIGADCFLWGKNCSFVSDLQEGQCSVEAVFCTHLPAAVQASHFTALRHQQFVTKQLLKYKFQTLPQVLIFFPIGIFKRSISITLPSSLPTYLTCNQPTFCQKDDRAQ
jgi:hypothetical protein